MEPAEYQALARRRHAGRHRWPSQGEKLFQNSRATPATRDDATAAGPMLDGPLRQAPCRSRTASDGRRRRSYIRESILNAAGEDRRRLPADHADLPGPDQRGASCCKLIAYIKSLGSTRSGERAPQGRRRRRRNSRHATAAATTGSQLNDATRDVDAHYLNVDYGVCVVAADARPQAHRASCT